MLRWYLIHTKVSAEAIAQRNLERQGYEVYLPRLAQSVRFDGRWRDCMMALFPRYLFLRLDEGRQPLAPVRSTVGVATVVRFGSRYTTVPDKIVNELRSRADPVSGLHRLKRKPLWVAGATVRITAGSFEGLEGIFERFAGSERVLVLLNLLGQEASVRIPSACIAA